MARKKKLKLTRQESLDAKPVRNQAFLWEKDLNEEVVIFIPRRESRWINLLAKISYVPPQRKIVLDRLGSEVWELCDGRTTVAEMIEAFSLKHQLNRKEAEVSITAYLKQMARKGLIGFLLNQRDRLNDEVKESENSRENRRPEADQFADNESRRN